MKTTNYLWAMVCTLFCQFAYTQTVESNIADPLAQLKQVFKLRHVGAPLLRMPDKISKPQRAAISAFNIARNMTEAKLKCPLLKLKSTLQLEGERNSNELVGLKWETTNGYDNRAFDVERSFGDTLNFEKINFVWASKRIGQEIKYKLPDNNNYSEASYYRLKLLLNDGSYAYSNIAFVKGYENITFSLYPNPASDRLKINLSAKEEGSISIIVFDGLGRTVQQHSTFLNKGSYLKEINVANLPGGLYTLKMILPGKEVRVGKFSKK